MARAAVADAERTNHTVEGLASAVADGIDDTSDGVVEGFSQAMHFGTPLRFQFLPLFFRLKAEPVPTPQPPRRQGRAANLC
jgi:hypothetical protein